MTDKAKLEEQLWANSLWLVSMPHLCTSCGTSGLLNSCVQDVTYLWPQEMSFSWYIFLKKQDSPHPYFSVEKYFSSLVCLEKNPKKQTQENLLAILSTEDEKWPKGKRLVASINLVYILCGLCHASFGLMTTNPKTKLSNLANTFK